MVLKYKGRSNRLWRRPCAFSHYPGQSSPAHSRQRRKWRPLQASVSSGHFSSGRFSCPHSSYPSYLPPTTPRKIRYSTLYSSCRDSFYPTQDQNAIRAACAQATEFPLTVRLSVSDRGVECRFNRFHKSCTVRSNARDLLEIPTQRRDRRQHRLHEHNAGGQR